MNSFALEIWDNEGSKCTFYTVRWDDAEYSETDKFFIKYDELEEHTESAKRLLNFIIHVVGETYGAIDALFNRQENEVTGLPSQGKIRLAEVGYYPNFPLRLYALKINEHIVVLFNGGVKDAATNQQASLLPQWREACAFAKKITEAIQDKTIVVDTFRRELRWHNDDSKEIILF